MFNYVFKRTNTDHAQESSDVAGRLRKSAECIRWENEKTEPNITAMKKSFL